MNRTIRSLAMFLAFVIFISVPVSAMEMPPSRASYYFAAVGARLIKSTTTSFEVEFDVTATGAMDKIGATTIVVERSSDCINWTTIKTYRSSSYSSMIRSNSAGHLSRITHPGTPGYYYRAKITFYAENSSGSAIYDYYTDTMYL